MGSKTYVFIVIVFMMFVVTTSEYVYIKQNPNKPYTEIMLERFEETRSMVINAVKQYTRHNK